MKDEKFGSSELNWLNPGREKIKRFRAGLMYFSCNQEEEMHLSDLLHFKSRGA
ncbi:MAG: hypothetical protein AB8G05_00915 [Oligoflexales bacterium]